MSDYMELTCVPVEEPCQQVGMPSYDAEKARDECRRFIDALRITIGPEPEGARFKVKGNPHDFGTYYEVQVVYENDEARDYAYRCESEMPSFWPQEMTLWTTCPPAYDGFGTIRPGDADPARGVRASDPNRRVLPFTRTEQIFHRVIVDPQHKDWQLGRYQSGGVAVAAGSVEEERLFGRDAKGARGAEFLGRRS
jgi:hypothetical protein